MNFSDELYLVTETREKNALRQFETTRSETSVWCDLTSISGQEVSTAGQNGHKAEARADVHTEDYAGQKIVRYPGGLPLIPAGYYEVYRTFLKGDVIELYLMEKEGVR